MSIYDESENGLRLILNAKEIAGIISYCEDGVLSQDGLSRILNTISGFCVTALAVNATSLECFATAGLRGVSNADDIVRAVREKTGVEIHIISGEEEARLDFIGAYFPDYAKEGLVVDMGGGSTEILRFKGKDAGSLKSIPFGSLFLYKRFVSKILPDRSEFADIRHFVKKQLAALDWLPGSAGYACIIGGTARAIARLHRETYGRENEDLQGYEFDAGDFERLLQRISEKKKTSVRDILRVTPERIHTIIPGLVTFSELVRITGCKRVSVSKNGVREGFIKAYVKKAEDGREN